MCLLRGLLQTPMNPVTHYDMYNNCNYEYYHEGNRESNIDIVYNCSVMLAML